jgi:outer membrane receptor protein involved in Fe transport
VYNDVAPYQINERYYQSGTFPYGSVNGFYKSGTAVDANIKKEKLNSTELGMNLAFFKGRLLFDAAYFSTKTTDLITNTTPSISSGASSYLTNIGELKGSGYEFTLGGAVVKTSDFTWNLSMNIYHYETVVSEIKEGLDEIAIDVYSAGYGTYAIKDEAFPQIKAVSYVRDDRGRIVVDKTSGNPLVGGIEKMGKTTPDIILGLNSSINWKGITLSTTMDYRGGFIYYSQGSDIMEFTGRSMESVSADRKDFVWPNSVVKNDDGTYTENTNIPITGGKMAFWKDHYNQIKENYVKDASAFKLREVSVSYTLSNDILDKTPFTKLTVGAVGRNLFTYFPNEQYRFSDPEFRNTRSSDSSNGIGIGGYLSPPPTRSFGFSVNVEF